MAFESLEARTMLSVQLDNGLASTDPLYYRAIILNGGSTENVYYGTTDTVYEYRGYLQVGTQVFNLESSGGSPSLEGDRAVSTTTLNPTSGGQIAMRVENRIPLGTQSLITTYSFTATGGASLTGAKFFQYLDSDVQPSAGDDVLTVAGSIAGGDLRVITIDPANFIQGAQVLGQTLTNAVVTGFAADRYNSLAPQIEGGNFNPPATGTINLTPNNITGIGAAYGPADTVSAIAYSLTSASSATVRTTLKASDIAINFPDLAVTNVGAPAAIVAGGTLDVNWVVQNKSETSAVGSWTDAVYFSSDATFSDNDLRVGSLVHSGGLIAQNAYFGSLAIDTAGVPAGTYYVIVRTDDTGLINESRLETNNSSASDSTLQAGVQSLTSSVATRGTLSNPQPGKWYAVNVDPGTEHLWLTLNDLDDTGTNRMYASFGEAPTPSEYQYRSVGGEADQQLAIPAPAAGTWYILVQSEGVTASGDFDLTAQPAALALASVTPGRTAENEPAILSLTGLGFDATTQIRLISQSGQAFVPANIDVWALDHMTATFNAGALPVGTYDVRISEPDGEHAELNDSVVITGAGTPDFRVNLITPAAMGYHELATLILEYSNEGDAPMRAPLIFVTGEQSGRKTPWLTLDRSRITSGFWTSAKPAGFENYAQVLASGETPGWLLPGESERVEIYYAGWQQPWDLSYPPFNWSAAAIPADATATIEWDTFEDQIRPTGISNSAWAPVFDNITASIGNSWGGWVTMLGENARYLAELGEPTVDGRRLASLEYLQAQGVNPLKPLASAIDAMVGAPGIELSFGRFFPGSITSNQSLGAFGYGWVNPWDIRLTQSEDGTVQILNPTGSRTYLPDSRGGFLSEPGDANVLTARNPASAGFSLRDATGQITLFDATGRLESIEDINGNQITATYTNNLLTKLQHTSGDSLTITYNIAGRIASITDNFGRATTFSYDVTNEHLLTATSFNGSFETYAYQTTGSAAQRHALTSITYADGTRSSFAYDTHGWLTQVQNPDFGGPLTFTYDIGAVTATDSTGVQQTFLYDDRGQLVRVDDASGDGVSRFYDDHLRLTKMVDALGRVTEYRYDNAGRLIQSTDPLGAKLNLAYDAGGRLRRVVDQIGATTSFEYDTPGNLTRVTDAAGRAVNYAYNDDAQLTTKTNARNQAVQYTYDSAGRMSSATLPGSTPISYSYDARGNMVSVVDATGTTVMTYDSFDRMTRITYPGGLFLQYEYDSAGRRTQMTDQSGREVEYEYDDAGMLSRVVDGSGALITRYTYDDAGRLTRQDQGNGAFTTYDYDGADRIVQVVNHSTIASIASQFDYVYDVSGNLSRMTTLEGRWDYSYDALGRLVAAAFTSNNTNATPNQNLVYEYDAAGNRTRTIVNGASSDYDVNSLSQYLAAGTATYSYDFDGNLSTRTDSTGTWNYTYDALNRLIAVSNGTDNYSYVYNGLGQRVSVTHNGVVTRYVVDPSSDGNLVGEYTNANTLIARYDYGWGLVSQSAGGGASYYQFDALGNTAGLLGAAGVVQNRYSYQPFGQTMTRSETTPNHFEFVGQWGVTAEGFGASMMGARFYDPIAGRFIQRDPSGIGGGINPYTYVRNNPTRNTDASGRVVDNIMMGKYLMDAIISYVSRAETGVAAKFVYNLATLSGYGMEIAQASLTPQAALRKLLPTVSRSAWRALIQEVGLQWGVVEGIAADTAATEAAAAASAARWAAIKNSSYVRILGPVAVIWGGGIAATKTIGYVTGSDAWDDAGNAMISALTPSGWGVAYDYYRDWLFGKPSQTVGSRDPNAKTGPAGAGSANFIIGDQPIPYRVDFENDSTATAPAQFVTITDPLSSNLDWSTFEFTEIAWGDTIIPVPAGSKQFQTVQSMTYNGVTFDVRVNAQFNPATGIANVAFSSIDPLTEVPPAVSIGFLPPEDDTGRGQGHFSYLIHAKSNLVTGTAIRNVATITFDVNAPIATNQRDPHDASQGTDPTKEALVTIDAAGPTSNVTPLPSFTTNPTFNVAWTGHDDTGGSGIAYYDVFVSTDNGPATLWLGHTTSTSASFVGSLEHTYRFYTRATDAAGHLEAAPSGFDASINVTATPLFESTLLPGKKYTFKDANGSDVTLAFTGKTGSVVVARNVAAGAQGDIAELTLVGTDLTGSLTFTAKGGTDLGLTTLGKLAGSTSLSKLTGAMVDLTGEGIILTGAGTIASISLRDLRNGADITLPGTGSGTILTKGISLTLARVGPGSAITLGAGVGTLSLLDASTGTIAAPWITKLSTKADTKRAVTGGFAADITLSGVGAPKGITLGAATIAGAISAGTWSVTGGVTSIAAASTATGWTAIFSTANLKSLSTTKGILSGNITAGSIASVTAKTDFTNANLRLLRPVDPAGKLLALGKLTVSGWMDSTVVRSDGHIGAVSVGAMNNSGIYAGVRLTEVGVPDAIDDFTAQAKIASVTMKGLHTINDPHSFINSKIAAHNLLKLSLVGVKRVNGSTHGIAARDIGTLTVVQPDKSKWTWPARWQDFGDFVVRELG